MSLFNANFATSRVANYKNNVISGAWDENNVPGHKKNNLRLSWCFGFGQK